MQKTNDLKRMHHILINCIEVMNGKEIPEEHRWIANCQPVATKIVLHSLAIGKLLEGTLVASINGIEHYALDFPSMGSISRSLLESYLLFNYIFVRNEDYENKKFYHEIWRLGGLLDRQKFIATSKEMKNAQLNEISSIESIKKYIINHVLYNSLTKNEKKEALKGKWRTGKHWNDIAGETGIHNNLFRMLYSYLSAHVHSGYISILQISQAFSKETQEKLSIIYIHISMIIASHFLISYSRLFGDVKLYLEKNIDDLNFVERTYITADQFEEHIAK